jgi:hypothetical protein
VNHRVAGLIRTVGLKKPDLCLGFPCREEILGPQRNGCIEFDGFKDTLV